MKKIPSVFERDWKGDKSRVLPVVAVGCEWVMMGLGVGTRKYDGTACLWQDGKLWHRYDAKQGKTPPADFLAAQPDPDPATGHWPGWLPVGMKPETKWHREALALMERRGGGDRVMVEGATYELVGPKVQGNPERFEQHELIRHGADIYDHPGRARSFEGIRDGLQNVWLIEGLVYHHADGRMAKVKATDFGIPWPRR